MAARTKTLSFCAYGPFALFTCPSFKTEKVSYDVMTVPAARGIVQAILWKPAVNVIIERIIVCNPIRRGTITVNGVSTKVRMPNAHHFSGEADPSELIQDAMAHRIQTRNTMLLDVRYVVEFHYEMTDLAGPEESSLKFEQMFERRLMRGSAFRLPHFGLQQHVANCRPVRPTDLPIDDTKDLGRMPHYRIYGDDDVDTVWFDARMVHGVIDVPAPYDPSPTSASDGAGGLGPDRGDRSDDLGALERKQRLERDELERIQARERAELARARVAAREGRRA